MKWVLMIPDTLIQPRAICSTTSAYVSSDSPRPPYSSGIVSPNRPSSFIPSTISVGYSSRCSSSVATGRILSSTNERTVLRISDWMSVRSSVSHRRPMGRVLPVPGTGQHILAQGGRGRYERTHVPPYGGGARLGCPPQHGRSTRHFARDTPRKLPV